MSTELASDRITQAIAEYRKSDEIIARLKVAYLSVTLAENGFETVTAARKEIKRLRVGVEKLRKELKAEALEFGRAVDGEAARLTALIEPVEKHLEAQEAIHIAAKEAERMAKELEKSRITQARINRLTAAECVVDLASCQTLTDPQFESYFDALVAEAARHKAQRDADALAAWKIGEADREERERHDAERQAAIEEQAETNKREADRLAAEREELRKVHEVIRKAEHDRLADIAQREAAEQQKIQDERKAEAAAAELVRAEALKPEIDKVVVWRAKVEVAATISLDDLSHPVWRIGAMRILTTALDEIVDRVSRGEVA